MCIRDSYAFEAGRRAIEEHYRRLGIPARVENASFYGMYRTIYEWKKEPLVSIIDVYKRQACGGNSEWTYQY